MKLPFMKAILGSAVAIILGTSCCWISAFAIWVGGFTFLGLGITIIQDIQFVVIFLTAVIIIIAILIKIRLAKVSIDSE